LNRNFGSFGCKHSDPGIVDCKQPTPILGPHFEGNSGCSQYWLLLQDIHYAIGNPGFGCIDLGQLVDPMGNYLAVSDHIGQAECTEPDCNLGSGWDTLPNLPDWRILEFG
jgi:hypothetical protein